MHDNTTGTENLAIGYDALYTNTSNSGITAVGDAALQYSNGIDNTAIGCGALQLNTNGSDNTSIGYSAGGCTSGYANTFIGAGASTSSYIYDATSVGANSYSVDNASIKLGDPSISYVATSGHIRSLNDNAPPTISVANGGLSSTVSITGSDVAGLITYTIVNNPPTSPVITVTFATPYGYAPMVVFSPASEGAAATNMNALEVYVTNVSTTGFQLTFLPTVPTTGSSPFSWYYHVIEMKQSNY